MLSPSSTASSGSPETSSQQPPKAQNVALRTKKQTKVKEEEEEEDTEGSVKSAETTLTTTSKSSTAVRKRRTHRKSRLGCSNCKMRSVKCDESKPHCGRCVSSGFTCSYSTLAPALEVAYSGVFQIDLGLSSRGTPPLVSKVIPLMKGEGGGVTTYQMRPYEVAAIDRYLHRTVNSFQVKRPNDKEKAVDMANANPFLFHIFTGFALLHDVHVSADPAAALKTNSKALAFHWCQIASLFKQRLEEYVTNPNRSVADSDRDALWMCSALMTCGIFANIDSFDPLKSYPIKPSDPQDFSWVKIDRGVHIVWALTDPTRPDSHYYDFYQFMESCNMPDCRAPIRLHCVPEAFTPLFDLSVDSNVDNNPYHGPIAVLSQVQDDEVSSFRASLRHFGFVSQVRPQFLEKLETKDPRALLILALWYSKMSTFDWWFCRPRPLVEGVSICLYLERYHADHTQIIELLQEPKRAIFAKYDSMPWASKVHNHEERMRSLAGRASPVTFTSA